ncbi:phosphodiesterase [Motiliproteus sp. MSK22-1]|uniref:phosphodiesterase n=1 Tax=Motiliproteus sp. MSK22-1 TaxID=1897630 RepID=UPI00097865DA|nr:phosphodiesterase [Motiliproteus sp. MSK22-1]OMH38923.1 hypothetical protein BGP75_00695 [Motiliproteus sp. MSK22-1]
MLIAQITDLHVGRVIETTSGPIDLLDRLVDAVNEINHSENLPTIVMVTGDISNHGHPDDYLRAKKVLDTLTMPYYIVPGNHDHRQQLRKIFAEHQYLQTNSPFLNYTLEQYSMRIIALDSLNPGTHTGLLCDERLKWVDEQLAQQPEIPALVFLHHPPNKIGSPYVDRMMCTNGETLGKIIEQHPQVKGVACGHVHRDVVISWHRTVLFITGSSAFSYDLMLKDVDDLDPVFEPSVYRLFNWQEETGLISHLCFIGHHPRGLSEGVPLPPS